MNRLGKKIDSSVFFSKVILRYYRPGHFGTIMVEFKPNLISTRLLQQSKFERRSGLKRDQKPIVFYSQA